MSTEQSNDSLFNIFGFLSKAVIIVPVSLLVAVLIFKYVPDKSTTQVASKRVTMVPTATPTPTVNKIDLTSPAICNYKDQTSSVSAQIKDKKIKATILTLKTKTTATYMLNGDCLYVWPYLSAKSGLKMCGIGFAMKLLDLTGGNFDMSALTSMDSVKGLIPQTEGSSTVDPALLGSILSSCVRTNVTVADTAFDIPKTINFVDSSTIKATSPKKTTTSPTEY